MGGFLAGLLNAAGDPTLANRADDDRKHAQKLSDEHRLMSIQELQNTRMNLGRMMRTKVNTETGLPLSENELHDIMQRDSLASAQLSDLWNGHQDPTKPGANVNALQTPQMNAAKQPAVTMSAPAPAAQQGSSVTPAPGVIVADPDPMTKPQAPGMAPVTLPASLATATGPNMTLVQKLGKLQETVAQYSGEMKPYQNKVLQGQNDLEGAGVSHADALRSTRIGAGLEPAVTAPKDKAALKLYQLKNGTRAWLDASHPELLPEGATAVGAGSAAQTWAKGGFVRSAQSPTGFAQILVSKADPTKRVGWWPVTPSRYYVGTQNEKTSIDNFGVKTTSSGTTKPLSQGEVNLGSLPMMSEGGGAETANADDPQAAPSAPNPSDLGRGAKPKPEGKKTAALRAIQTGAAPSGTAKQLDSSGHIPPNAANPQLVEAANSLIDGMDVTKLPVPQKDRAAVEGLARQYGWKGQGQFTPREQLQMREAETFLNTSLTDSSLKVLDSWESRVKLSHIISQQKNPGMVGGAISATLPLSKDEQAFLRMFNQLVGTISGLSQLTRSGRVTEAQVGRLMKELPDPSQTRSASDAAKRLHNILKELNIARSGEGGGSQVDQFLMGLDNAAKPK